MAPLQLSQPLLDSLVERVCLWGLLPVQVACCREPGSERCHARAAILPLKLRAFGYKRPFAA
jgi:hypothetical protein